MPLLILHHIKSCIEINLWSFDIHLKIVFINFPFDLWQVFRFKWLLSESQEWIYFHFLKSFKNHLHDEIKFSIHFSISDWWSFQMDWEKPMVQKMNFLRQLLIHSWKRQKSKDLIPMLFLILFDLDYFAEIKLSKSIFNTFI